MKQTKPCVIGGSFSQTHPILLRFKFEWREKLNFLSGKWKTKDPIARYSLTHISPQEKQGSNYPQGTEGFKAMKGNAREGKKNKTKQKTPSSCGGGCRHLPGPGSAITHPGPRSRGSERGRRGEGGGRGQNETKRLRKASKS